jgi:hypothetical protein
MEPLRLLWMLVLQKTSFEGGWGILGTHFQKLKYLCSGFASVFPGTRTVESDFSVIE